jgi:hypothetical protein
VFSSLPCSSTRLQNARAQRRVPRRALAAGLAAVAVGAAVVVVASLRGDAAVETAAGAQRLGAPGVQLDFRETASAVGIRFAHGAFRYGVSADPPAMVGGGLCWIDHDGDGMLDLYAVNGHALADRGRWLGAGGLPRSRLFRNVGDRFVDVTAASGAGLAVRGQGCVAADLDRDGDTDLFVTTAERNALLRNEGDGTFVEAAKAAGLDAFGWFAGAAVGDVNADGWPDLLVTGYVDLNASVASSTLGFPNTYRGRRDLLFLGNGRDGEGPATFREVGVEAGLEAARYEYGLGAVLSDLDRDGDLDAYVANDTNPNRLYENVAWPGGADADPFGLGFRFEERAAAAGVADPGSGMGVAVADYDGDGRNDLFVTNARRQAHAAYRSLPPDEHQPSFADVRDELGARFSGSTGWGASWADLDLDADLDLVLANGQIPVTDLEGDRERVQVFLNERGRLRAWSSPSLPRLLGRGSTVIDFDNDGDLDVAATSVGGRIVLLENTSTKGNWLELDGVVPGTQATVVLPGGRRLFRELLAGSSYLSSEDPRLHFGLGSAGRVRELVVRWPGGEVTRLSDVRANRRLGLEAPG